VQIKNQLFKIPFPQQMQHCNKLE